MWVSAYVGALEFGYMSACVCRCVNVGTLGCEYGGHVGVCVRECGAVGERIYWCVGARVSRSVNW